MNNNQVISLYSDSVMNTYARFPIAIERGEGAMVYDFEGKEYIDFTSGIGVNSIGHGNKRWVEAIAAQAAKLGHMSNLYHTEPGAKLAKILCKRAGMSNVFFANSGAESNEGVIKLARKYSHDKYGEGRSAIVTLINSFHGRTITTLAATGQDIFHKHFFPFTEGFKYAAANDIESIKAACSGNVCAIMLELVQGEGGVLPLDKQFVEQVAELCAENDILLILDEVQTGIGRTGSLFAFEQYGVKPDLVSFAKGIAGGLPLGGFMANEKCRDVLAPGTHGATFGGNPIAAAAALTVLEILDENALKEVTEKGNYIREKIEGMESPYIVGIRGLGLMLGISVKGLSHKELVGKLIDAGLLALTAGSDTIRFLPPLTITYEEIDTGLKIFGEVMNK